MSAKATYTTTAEVNLRAAVLGDLEQLCEIERLCFTADRQSKPQAIKRSILSKSQQVWVLEESQAVVASMTLHRRSHSMRVFSLAVHPAQQGRGFGVKLLDCAEQLTMQEGLARLVLEVDESNPQLVAWYLQHDFRIKDHLKDYYAVGIHALRLYKQLTPASTRVPASALEQEPFEVSVTGAKHKPYGAKVRNILVLDNPQEWQLDTESVKVVSANDYLSKQEYQLYRNTRVFNLCSSYRYQSVGYYVSLLAAARGQRPIPNVATMQDFKSPSITRILAEDVDELLERSLKDHQGKEFVLPIYFGQCLDPRFAELSRRLYQLFEAPLLEVVFVYAKRWIVQRATPLALKSLPEEDRARLPELARQYFARKRFSSPRSRRFPYSLAILLNPEEQDPPSCEKALQKFKKTAEKRKFYVEFITKEDYSRLNEFDVLFIRETTAVNHYTYRFSRAAHAEGLVVVDDPWSILRCANKVYLSERLQQAKIPTPRTWVLQRNVSKAELLPGMEFPFVLKQPDSSFSKGVVKVENPEEFSEKLKQLFKSSDLILAQEYVPSEFDWRVGVLNGRALFACRYYMAKGHWQIYDWSAKSDVYWGKMDTLDIAEVPDYVRETALDAAELIGDGLYGIDLKEFDGKAYVIEVNDNPNIEYGYEDKVLKDRLYEEIVDYFLERVELLRAQGKQRVAGGAS